MRTIKLLLAASAAVFVCTVTFAAAPDAPTGVVASTNDTEKIRLTWNSVDGAAYYVVYRYGGNTSQTSLEQFTVSGTSYDDTTCAAGEKIRYRVRSFDSVGSGSDYSAYVRGYREPILEPYHAGSRSINPLGTGGAGQSFKIRCNVDWTITADSWILPRRYAYSGTNAVVDLCFDLAPNMTGEIRCGQISIRAGANHATLDVWQGASVIPAATVWNGDAGLAVLEEAACAEDFGFRREYPGAFLAIDDATAAGGSCLRTTPITTNGAAVIAWTVPSDRTVSFSWRKDTTKSGDSFKVYEGILDANGLPDLDGATLLATCGSTNWTQVTLGAKVDAKECLFFVFKKTASGTVSASSGFGYLDNLSLMTLPAALTFADPVTFKDGVYSLDLGDETNKTVFVEAIMNHTVVYGGETHSVTRRVSPSWRCVAGQIGLVGCHPGQGEDGGDAFFLQGRATEENFAVWRATYTEGGVTVTQDLKISAKPQVAVALDCAELSGCTWGGWSYATNAAFIGGAAAWSGTPAAGMSRTMTAHFAGPRILRFSWRSDAPSAGETASFSVDGRVCNDLGQTDGEWCACSVYVGGAGEHTVAWTFAKTSDEPNGSGIYVDEVTLSDLPKSVIVPGNVAGEPADFSFADFAVTDGPCSLTATAGGEWLDVSKTVEVAPGVYFPAFAAGVNDTGAARGGRLRFVCGETESEICVVQSADEESTLLALTVEQQSVHVVSGEPYPFTVALNIGDSLGSGSWYSGFTALGWEHSFGDRATIEDGVLTVTDVHEVLQGSVSAELSGVGAYTMVTVHPSPADLAPDGVTLAAYDWRVEEGAVIKSANAGVPASTADLWATVAGPGVLSAEWKVSSEPGDVLRVSMDGVEVDAISGTGGAWETLAIAVPEGEHVVTWEYVKDLSANGGEDAGWVRTIGFVPCTFTGEIGLDGPSALTSGAKGVYTFLKTYTNETQGVGMRAPISLDGATVTTAADDERTKAAVTTEFMDGKVVVKVPFAVEWSDTVTLTTTLENDGTTYAPSRTIAVSPISLKTVLDYSGTALSGFGVPQDSVGEVEVSSTKSTHAVRLTSQGGTWYTAQLSFTAMDGGTLGFSYQVADDTVSVGAYTSMLKVIVDGAEATSLSDTQEAWETSNVVVSGEGPHTVIFAFAASSEHPETAEAFVDLLTWTPDGEYMTTPASGALFGQDALGANEDGTEFHYRLITTEPKQIAMTPQYCSMEVLSGDTNAVSFWSTGDTLYLYAAETVRTNTTVVLKAFNTVAGVNADAQKTVTVAARAPVDIALFDTEWYENCWLSDEYGAVKGWTGCFDASAVGGSAAKTVPLADDEIAEMTVIAYGAGTLSFDWKVSSDPGDKLQFWADPSDLAPTYEISGTGAGWQHVTIRFDEADDGTGNPVERRLRWVYAKKGDNQTAGEDCAWVDNLVWDGSTPAGIQYENTDLPWELTPGSTVIAKIEFYRKRNMRLQQQQQQYISQPAADAPLPTITWTVSGHLPEALTNAVSYFVDGGGNLVISLAEDCALDGEFTIAADYSYGGVPRHQDSTVTIGSGPPVVMANSKTASGVPHVWLARNAASGLSVAALETTSTRLAANGVNTYAECYEAGLDPRDENAQFKVSVTVSNGVPYVTWSPDMPGRNYVIMGKTNLTDAVWMTPTNAAHRFFKVVIER